VIPDPGAWLSFDYAFVEGAASDDEFGFFLFDATGGSILFGFDFYTDAPGAGSIAFNLTPLSGLTLGLQFQLSALLNDADFDSQVTVSNVRVGVVPEPATLTLFVLSGGVAFSGAIRRRLQRKG
jgi:hypothetical protein